MCLGHPIQEDLFSPVLVEKLAHKTTIDVACGDKFTVVIQEKKKKNLKVDLLENFKK